MAGPISQNYHAIVQSASIVDGRDDAVNGGGKGVGVGGTQLQSARRQLSVLTRRTMARDNSVTTPLHRLRY